MSCAREAVRGLGGPAIPAAGRHALTGESRGHLGAGDVASWVRAADGGQSGPMESAECGASGWFASLEDHPAVRGSKPPLQN